MNSISEEKEKESLISIGKKKVRYGWKKKENKEFNIKLNGMR